MDWRKLLGAKSPAIPDLEASLSAQRAEAASAEAEIAALRERRRSALLDGTDDALRKHDDATAGAIRRRDRAAAAADELAARLDTARAAAAEAARRARYAAAAAMAKAATDELRRVYPDAVSALRALLRQLAEAELAVAAANADRPSGAPLLEGPESFRLGRGRHEQVVASERVELWADRTGRPHARELQRAITVDATGHGRVPRELAGTPGVQSAGLRKIAFTATTIRPADGFSRIEPLAATLALPPMIPGEVPGWLPQANVDSFKPATAAASILAAIEAAESAAPRRSQPDRVRYEVLDPRELYWDPTEARDGSPAEAPAGFASP